MGKALPLRLALLAILFAPLLALVAEAQLSSLTEGSIYRIQNKAYPTRYLTPNSNDEATAQAEITAGADGYLTQNWYVSVYADQDLSGDKKSLYEQIDILQKAYIGETGFVSARIERANKKGTYTWRQPKYAQAADELTDLVNRMYDGLKDAQTVYDKSDATLSEVATEIENCKKLILEAKNKKYYRFNAPVTVSTKDGAIIYYSITEKYGKDKDKGLVLQYNENGKFPGAEGGNDPYKVKPVQVTPAEDFLHAEINNPNQAFYFMPGDKASELYIYSYDGRRMCSIAGDLAEGDDKITFLEENSAEFNKASCVSWEIIENASNSGYYNLRAIPTSETGNTGLYLASYSDPEAGNLKDTHNMGYLATPDNDKALFLLQRNKLSGARPKYIDLYNEYKVYEAKVGWIPTINELGYIANPDGSDEYDAYMHAYTDAYHVMNNDVAYTDDQLDAYISALGTTFSALKMYVPTEATYYTFNSGLSALKTHSLAIDPTTRALSATTGMVQTEGNKTTEQSQALWLLTPVADKDNTVTMQNVHTGLYVQSFAGGTLSMGEQPAEIVLASRDLTTGQFAFKASNYVLTAAEADGTVGVETEAVSPAADAADCWTATAVTDLTTVQHPVSITPYGKAGFYSSHEVKLPAGVQAWYMEGTTQVDGDGVTRITMTKVEPETDDGRTILPKETAVLLVTPTAPNKTTTYNLTYSTTAKAAIKDNKLSGVAYSQPVQGGAGTTCYKFGVVDGLAALYPMYQEYNADGELTNPGTDDGGYIKASANKIYLKILSSGASRLEFRFTDPTTGIEQIIPDANATTPADTYYDLQGRRIQGRPAGGIYIVNGVKRIIRR